jgi:outer membrane scaffolding protein for murein synthesis (MipA/OmpV family)
LALAGSPALAGLALDGNAVPADAVFASDETAVAEAEAEAEAEAGAAVPIAVAVQSGPPAGGPPPGVATGAPPFKPVFDETWATVGVGAGLVPSYSGSDDYILFPLPLIVGRVGGVGISPNGPGFVLDVLSQPPRRGKPETSFSFGPSFRFRNDRDGQFGDDVVELAGDLETAIEVGVQGGVSFPGVLNANDRLSLSTQVRWDILGAHEGMLIEPGVSYFTPLGRAVALQLSANAGFVDDNFADYYYSVTPAASAATGLPQFTADGGLNSVGALGILTFDLSGNLLDGGFNIYSVAGYSRLVGDAADTPYTSIRGSAGQFIGGIGVGYTF